MNTGKHMARTTRRQTTKKQVNIVSWDAVQDREKRRAKEPQADVRVLLKNQSATLGITPSQLEVLPKSALIKHARERGIVVYGESLSNSNVRAALRPYLPSGKELKKLLRKVKDKKKIVGDDAKKTRKSKYQSSKWERVTGELVEVSVYGPGGPTDSDFVQLAKQHVDEKFSEEELTRKKRAELVHEWAERFSGEYFRMVYSGEISPTGQPRDTWENGTAPECLDVWGAAADPTGIMVELNDDEEAKDGEQVEYNAVNNLVKATGQRPAVLPAEREGYERWAALEDKDFSVYNTKELNERLLLAAKEADVMAVNVLVQAGARVNCRGKEGGGMPPLAIAVVSGNLPVARRLLQLGANVSTRVELRSSLLHLASGMGRPDMAELLVSYGADLEAINYGGWTPAHCGALLGHFRYVKQLAQLGANLSAVSLYSGETPAQLARKAGLERIADAIELLEGLLEEGVIPRQKVLRLRPSSPQPMESSEDEEEFSLGVSDETYVQALPKKELMNREEGERALQELEETLDQALMSPQLALQ